MQVNYLLLLLIAFQHCNVLETAKRRLINIEITNYTFTNYTADHVKSLELNFTKLAPNRYGLNMNFELYRQLPRNTEVRILTIVQPKKAVKPMTFFDMRWNLCEALSNFKALPFLIDLYKEIKRTFNVRLVCPLKGNFRYRITNFMVTNEMLPSFTPELSFSHSLELYEDQNIFAKTVTLGYTWHNSTKVSKSG
ncbi:uncharacterized protein [Musca autumnalis]|uniref:uncharacterized protein n=1 Tax=Musca autumnalis TaxID=221902 RepID=UPI003CF70A11